MAYETITTGSFPCPCGKGKLLWERTEHDHFPGSGRGSPRLECGSCDWTLWGEGLTGEVFYVTPAEGEELEGLDKERWRLNREAHALCEERHGGRWVEALREAGTKHGGQIRLLRRARALRVESASTTYRHLRESIQGFARDSMNTNPLGVLAALEIDDPDVRELLEHAKAADVVFKTRKEALCTKPIPTPD